MAMISSFFRNKPDALVSFPKSGRTWLRVMLDEFDVRLRYTHAGAEHMAPVHHRVLSTAEARTVRRIVFLHRDPRDTVVSGYYQVARRLGGYTGTLSDFIRDPHHGIEKIVRFNAMWLDLARTRRHMLAVSYEDMHADTEAALARIVAFLGRRSDCAAVEATVRNNSFERMQARERRGDYRARYGDALLPADPADPDSFKVRRGRIGGYRDEMSGEDIAYCDAVAAAAAARR